MDIQHGTTPDGETLDAVRKAAADYETERQAVEGKVRLRLPIMLGLWLAAGLGLALLFNTVADPVEQWLSAPHVFLYVVVFVGAFFVYNAAAKPLVRFGEGQRQRLLPALFGFIGNLRYRHSEEPDSFAAMPRAAVGNFDRQTFDDIIAGRYEDFDFELFEAHFYDRSGPGQTTAFQGVVVAFPTIDRFPGLLVATRKANQVSGFFGGWFGQRQLDRVESGVAAVDSNYDFRTDNADAAKPIVSGRLAQALSWLGEHWPDEPARVALAGERGYLFLPQAKDFFALPPVTKPLSYQQDVTPIVADLVSILASAALVRKAGRADG